MSSDPQHRPEAVLLLGRASQILLTVARSLGRRGLVVEAATGHPEEPLLRSRYVSAVHPLPPYRHQPDRWLEELLELIQHGTYRLLLPVDEPSLYAVRAHRRELDGRLPLAMLDDEPFEIVFDKGRTHELAASLGVPVPRQILLHTPEDGRRAIQGEKAFAPPFVLKPLASYGGPAVSRRRDVRKVYDGEDLEPALEEMLEHGPPAQPAVLLQENVPGTGYGVEVLAAGGEILLSFAHRRIHEPIHGGGSSYRKSIDVPEELAEASRKLLRALRYTGVAMIEFKVDERSGSWVLLEINGRFWGSLPLAQTAGADFPYHLYRLLAHGERPEAPDDYRRGLYCRNLAGDAKWLLANLRADRSDPLLASRPLPAVVAETRHLLLLRERWDTFSLDDPRPAVEEVRHYAGLFLRRGLDRLRAAAVSLPPVRHRLAHRGRRAVRRSRRVLFVCKGNICRSPFAAAYLHQRLGDALVVTSSGFYPVPHRPSPPEAVAAATEFGMELGVDLEGHRSSVLTFRDVRRADVLVSFDEEVHRTVGELFPEARWKLHRLASLPETSSGASGIEFEDPFGGDLEIFRVSYRRIADAIDRAPWARKADYPEEPGS